MHARASNAPHAAPPGTTKGRTRVRPFVRGIGAPGFEPGTSPTRTARATRLRHAPRYGRSLLGRAGHGLVVPDRQPGHERLEGGVERRALALRPPGQAVVLDRLGLGDHVVAQLRMTIGEVR